MNNIKMIFMDSEGTLRNKDKHIASDTINIITKLENVGIPVVIITGLPKFIALKIAKAANIRKYLITSNGSSIYDIERNKDILSIPLNKEIVRDIYERNKDNYNIILSVGDFEYSNVFNEYNVNTKEIIDFSSIKEDILQCHISQRDYNLLDIKKEDKDYFENYILSNIDTIEYEIYHKFLNNSNLNIEEEKRLRRLLSFIKLKELKRNILKQYGDLINIGNQCIDFENYNYFSETPWFTFNKNGVSKGSALLALCNFLNIDPSSVLAIGNDYNDKSMKSVCGTFYCPNDASSSIIEMTNNVYENGDIGKVLKKVYEGR